MPNLCIIPARALDDEQMTFKELRALLAIGLHTSRDGSGVWASNRTLADEAGLDVRDLRRAVTNLEIRGYLRRVRRIRQNGADTTSMMAIVLDDVFPSDLAVDVIGREEGRITPPGEGRITPPGEGRITPPNDPLERPLVNGATPTTADALTFPHADMQEAYLAFRRVMPNRRAFDATLRSIRDGMTTGKAVAVEVLGTALLELAGNGEGFNVSRLRGYIRKHETQAARPAAEQESTDDYLERLRQEYAAKGIYA